MTNDMTEIELPDDSWLTEWLAEQEKTVAELIKSLNLDTALFTVEQEKAFDEAFAELMKSLDLLWLTEAVESFSADSQLELDELLNSLLTDGEV